MNRLKLLTALLAGLCASAAFAQSHGPVEVSDAVQQDVLGSLRDVKPNPADYHKMKARAEHDLPLPHVPDNQKDGALQGSGTQSLFTPAVGSTVLGLGNGFPGFTVQYAPPDTTGAVGATQFVQVVNVGLAVFDKATKAKVYGPVPTSTLWAGFGGGCQTNNDGDATVVYDKAANRWVVSQFSVSTTPYLQCVAVSQTSDATGAWNRYAFSYGNTAFPDYPKTGVWPDGYYTTFNIFNNGSTFGGAKLCAYDRAKMLAGAAATQQCFQLSTSFGGVLPSDLDGATAPPAGSPNYMMNFGSNSLNLWKFHVDWTTPASTTLTGPTNMSVGAFTPACNGGACIPQPVNQKLDSLADRLMYRLAYRNFGDHEALVVTHSVNPTPNVKNPKQQTAAVRWYEIRRTGTTIAVYQQGTYAPDSTARWMGSIAMDKVGDIALGYSASSSSSAPSIRYTGRVPTDTLGNMGGEVSLFAGTGSQTGSNLSRWGDYSAMTLDPGDDCTFWFTTEYIPSNGAFNWSTRIGSFKFPSCN